MSPSTKTLAKKSAKKKPAKKKPAAADKPAKCKPFSVSVKIVTPNDKHEILFGITKGCNLDNTAFWTIDFTLKVKKGTEMKTRVEVHVVIGKDQEKAKADALAAALKEKKELPSDVNDFILTEVKTRALEVAPSKAQDDPKLKGLLREAIS